MRATVEFDDNEIWYAVESYVDDAIYSKGFIDEDEVRSLIDENAVLPDEMPEHLAPLIARIEALESRLTEPDPDAIRMALIAILAPLLQGKAVADAEA